MNTIRQFLLPLFLLILIPSSVRDDRGAHYFVSTADSANYLTRPAFNAADAKYFDLVNGALQLNADELAVLELNGFVMTDRLAVNDFTTAYAYIYWKDLPVLITTDSILHSIHETYDDLLMRTEETILSSYLTQLLSRSREQLIAAASANTDSAMAPIYEDLETYLTVPLALLTRTSYDSPEASQFIEMLYSPSTITTIDLLGVRREIDFTMFYPRGHYAESQEAAAYFMAMTWLAQMDFRLVSYDPSSNPQLNLEALAGAALLRDTVDAANQRATWDQFDALLTAFVGDSDNMTLRDLDRFLLDAGLLTSPADILYHPDPDQLLTLLTLSNYGNQRITGQILSVAADNPQLQSRPVSFMLMGQRFAVDSYLMSNLVYDRLVVNGAKVERAMPSPLDVMYILGNNRAVSHLESELSRYDYRDNLETLRSEVEAYSPDFWTRSIYNRWLNMLRHLNQDTTGASYPQAMHTSAWADKMLHTQLASWAQLRHDNILYVKQSLTMQLLCEYPAGYVEPYPDFYASVREYAQAGHDMFANLNLAVPAQADLDFRQQALDYFAHLDDVATQLQILSQKELQLQPFTPEEENFLKGVVIRQSVEMMMLGCTAQTREVWDGWYVDLFPWEDESPALIVDVHTNPGEGLLGQPGVLHVGTGPVATTIFVADTDEGSTMYVGPGFTYYEFIEPGSPPNRLNDEDWKLRLAGDQPPAPPEWTTSFRLPASEQLNYLALPINQEDVIFVTPTPHP